MNETLETVITFLIDAYPRQEIQKGTIRVYKETLKDIAPDLLKAAVLAHITKSPFFPSVSELRDNAAALIEKASGDPDAFTAWGEVVTEISRTGSYGKPVFSCQRIEETVKGVGGWLTLCMSENIISDRARFVEAYNTYQARDRETRRMLPAVHSAIKQLAESKRLSLGVGSNGK